MLIVVAPSAITASSTRHRKSGSDRYPSSGENSTSSVRLRAKRVASFACSNTWSGVMRSFFSMWRGLVAMKVWMRERFAGLSASAAREMSRSFARASEQIVDSRTAVAIALTASKSPLLDAAKPASMMSTRMRSSWRAMRSFSSRVIEAPGDCSPSRRVVSKMMSLSAMGVLRKTVMLGELDVGLARGLAPCDAPPGADDGLQRGQRRCWCRCPRRTAWCRPDEPRGRRRHAHRRRCRSRARGSRARAGPRRWRD